MKIYVLPVNGYVNRLRAIASASIFATHFGEDRIGVIWNKEKIAPSHYSKFLQQQQDKIQLLDVKELEIRDFPNFKHIPEGISFNRDKRFILLKGGKMGEQFYLAELEKLLEEKAFNRFRLLIVSGGNFFLSAVTVEQYEKKKSQFYNQLKFSSEVLNLVNKFKYEVTESYIAVHIRSLDLRSKNPSLRQVIKKITEINFNKNLPIFIASDSQYKKNKLYRKLVKLDFTVLTHSGPLDRLKEDSAVSTIFDWIIIANSSLLICGESSFSEESVFMSCGLTRRIALKPSVFRKFFLKPFDKISTFYFKIYKNNSY